MLTNNQNIENKTILLFYNDKYFITTTTSDLLINVTKSEFSEKSIVLDLAGVSPF